MTDFLDLARKTLGELADADSVQALALQFTLVDRKARMEAAPRMRMELASLVTSAPFMRATHFTTRVIGASNDIVLRRFPIPLEVFYGGSWVDVRIVVLDRDTGSEEPVQFRFTPTRVIASPAEMIRDAIVWALTHEVEECLLVNGVRVFDPHRREGP